MFEKIKNSIAIGDTGNEIGMGNLYKEIIKEAIYPKPSIIKSKHLVLSSTSNWGCYGIIAYLSKLTKIDYLSKIEEKLLLKELNSFGVIDGITGKKEPSVDGYSLKETQEIIKHLRSC